MKKLLAVWMAVLMLIGCGGSGASVSEPEKKAGLTITNKANIISLKADMSGYQWLDNDNGEVFLETSMNEIRKLFTENGSGIIYFGYVGCPWCERAVPILSQAAQETGVKVYYINVHSTANTLDDYYELEPYIQETFELGPDREPVFKVPEVIGVKNGKIVGNHLALVEGYKIENMESQMNDEQKEQLKQIYIRIIEAAAD